MPDVTGKVVAITDASSGIGEAAGRLLASVGAKVVLGACRADRLETIAADISRKKGEVEVQAIDVTRREDLALLVTKARDCFGRLDVLISNAGLLPSSPLEDLKVDEWDRMIDVNIKGVLHGIAAAFPVFRKQGGGHFIIVSSAADRRIGPSSAVYSGTRLAVRAISEGLRQEVGDQIRVTIISRETAGFKRTETISSPGYQKRDLHAEAIAFEMAYAIGATGPCRYEREVDAADRTVNLARA